MYSSLMFGSEFGKSRKDVRTYLLGRENLFQCIYRVNFLN
jgi:hypothetical protein